MATFKENLATLRSIDAVDKITLLKEGIEVGTIPNAEGKRGSLQVYANVLNFQDGEIGLEQALQALEIFSEYVQIAKDNPGEHPNIDRLLDIVTGKSLPLAARITFK